MKILAAQYGTELFGRERENIECYKSFQRLGHDVMVFGSNRAKEGGETGRLLTELGLKCGEMPFGSHFSLSYFLKMKGYWWLQIKRVYWCSILLRTKAREMDADAIFLGGTMEFLYLWPFLLLQKRPVIYRVGDAPPWDSWFHKAVTRTLLRKAKLIAPVSHFIKNECHKLSRLSETKCQVIWNIPPAFTSAKQPFQDSSKSEGLKLVFVGQITEKKGVKVLLHALAALKEHSFECRIVGGSEFSGPLEKELHDMTESLGLANMVKFTGRVQDPTPHYAWADVHIAPSIYEEPFGLVIVEAKREGVPSIIFPLGGMPELVKHNENGWICASVSPTRLAEAILSCRDKPLHKWGLNAKEDEEQNFSTQRFDGDWNRILQLSLTA